MPCTGPDTLRAETLRYYENLFVSHESVATNPLQVDFMPSLNHLKTLLAMNRN